MVGNIFFVMQVWIVWATLHDEIQSNMLLRGLFKKYNNNRSGDFGFLFDGTETILLVLWQDLINYSHIVMFFGKSFDQSCPWGPVLDTMKYIMKQVLDMKPSGSLIVICKENMTEVSSTWSMYLDELRPNYYS